MKGCVSLVVLYEMVLGSTPPLKTRLTQGKLDLDYSILKPSVSGGLKV